MLSKHERLYKLEVRLQEVLLELRLLRLEEMGADEEEGIEVGDIVLIEAKGRYKGRLATVKSRRGTQYWNLEVKDPEEDEVEAEVWRKDAGLKIMRKNREQR